jgi:hypothetical protein
LLCGWVIFSKPEEECLSSLEAVNGLVRITDDKESLAGGASQQADHFVLSFVNVLKFIHKQVLGNGFAYFSGNNGVILQEPDGADKKIIQVKGTSAFQMLFVRKVGSSSHGLAICVRAAHKGLLE